ncbi:unnamed protein product [Candida verbasci]|uniref:C2H2-type domain-containing protein n=1 Tax=Candida verbasci TaxID=1227364 RepID=A0A9W4XBK8_9ASCO|nr:unnamed protein product [Candida verbasci]
MAKKSNSKKKTVKNVVKSEEDNGVESKNGVQKPKTPAKFQCKQCEKKFNNRESVSLHAYAAHKIPEDVVAYEIIKPNVEVKKAKKKEVEKDEIEKNKVAKDEEADKMQVDEANIYQDSRIVFIGAVARYIILTIWWIFFTQWCFGLPLMDKIFILTGGKCVIEKEPIHSSFIKSIEDEIWTSTTVTSYHCKKLKGNWHGGHDPSGHVFLLIHSSLYLFLETFENWRDTIEIIRIRSFKEFSRALWELPQLLIIALISLWWFMLLMTNTYFHSILEKLVGLIFGYIGIVLVYIIPRVYLKQKFE